MGPVTVLRHPRARRYVLRLGHDGGIRLTVPRRGSVEGGLKFVERQRAWIERERARMAERAQAWTDGTELWWRGNRIVIRVDADDRVTAGDQVIRMRLVRPSLFELPDLRPAVEAQFRKVASVELPARCLDLAQQHGVHVARVFVRNQRSRWGACSSTGTITLNWRLLQLPAWVADYVILHELMHRRQPNHSMRFWREVAAVCPAWREAERWIKQNGRTIL